MRTKVTSIVITIIIGVIFILNLNFGIIIVSGNSMHPTLEDGNILIYKKNVDKYYVNDIAIFSDHTGEINKGNEIVKRITNLDDDLVFLEGDNKENSLDSNSFGWVSEDDILGVVLFYK